MDIVVRIKVALDAGAGELDSETITIRHGEYGDDSDAIDGAVKDAVVKLVERCIISVGDTITIREVS